MLSEYELLLLLYRGLLYYYLEDSIHYNLIEGLGKIAAEH